MTFCPNKSLPEWKALEESQPNRAYYLWNKYKGEVPSKYYYPKEVDRKEKAISYLSKLFPGKETIFYDFAKEIGNKTQHGYVENGAINLWTSAEAGTEYHEAYHLLFRTMLSEEQRESLYKDASKEFGAPTKEEIEAIKKEILSLYDVELGDEEATKLVLEEKMGDGFMEHMLTEEESSRGILASIAKWFRDLFSWIKGLISNKIGLRDLYSLMETTRSNDTFLGRGVFRNPQAMQSAYNPSRLIEGIPSATVDSMVDGLTTMAIKEIDSWEVPEVGKILGDGRRTNGSIVNGLLYQIYEFKDGRVKSNTDIGVLQKAFSLELAVKNAELKYKSLVKQKRTEEAKAFKPELDAAKKNLADFTTQKGLKTKNLVPVKKGASKRDKSIARKKNTRRTQIMHVIQNWYGKKDPVTGNTLVPSWREWVIDELRTNQYSITKDVIKVNEVVKTTDEEGDTESNVIEARDSGADDKDIKGKSHFADSPVSKLSQKAKMLLRDIPILTPELVPGTNKIIYKTKKNPVFTNIKQTYSLRYVYKQLSELWADSRSFEEMEARLIEKSKYRPDYAAINQRVKTWNYPERALMYHSLAYTLAEFNLILLGENGRVMNANSSTTESRVRSQWTNQIVEVDGQSEEAESVNRAVYAKTISGEDEIEAEFTVKKSKYDSIKDALEKTYKFYTKKFKDEATANAAFMGKEGAIGSPAWELGSLIWEMGMNLGDNINKLSTIKNIQALLDEGFTATRTEGKRVITGKVIGQGAFKTIYELGRLEAMIDKGIAPLATSGQNINIGNRLKNPTPFFDTQKGGMKFLASLTPMFMSRSAESFVSPVNTAIYPVNMRTALSDIKGEILADIEKNKDSAFQLYRGDKFIFPPGMQPSHMFNHFLNNEEYRKVFKIGPTAGIRNYADEGLEYEDFNNLDFILTRLEAYYNNGDSKYFLCTIPAPGDRARNDMNVMPRISGHNSSSLNKSYADVFRNAILEDLFRIKQAKETIADPNATKIPDYHTGAMRGISDEFMQFDGVDEFGERIVKNKYISGKAGGRDMSDLVESYLNNKKLGMALSEDLNQFERNLTEMISGLMVFYQNQAEQIATLIVESERKKDLNTSLLNKWGIKSKGAKREEFIEGMSKLLVDFLIHEDLGRNEFIKYTRGNRALFKNIEEFTKRQRLLSTPVTKLAEKGTLGKGTNRNPTWLDEEYGADRSYEELVFNDPMGQITQAVQARMNAWTERTATQLIKSGYSPEEAAFTAQYMAGGFEEYDGLTIISIDWLKQIMMGGEGWFEYHEIAYQNYKKDPEGKFVYPAGVKLPKGAKAGEDIPIRPYKPFAQEVKKVGNTVASDLTKTAYFVALKSYTKAFPIMDDMRMRMEANPLEANNPYAGMKKIHTASAKSAKKGVHLNVFDIKNWSSVEGGFFANVKSNRNSTSALGFPQTIPPAKEDLKTVFGRQIKKNAIANVKPDELYYYNAGIEGETEVAGEDMTGLYHAAIEERLRRDFEKINKEIGLNEFRKVVEKLKSENTDKGRVNVDAIKGAQDFKDAKRKLLKNIRARIESQAIEREMSDAFIKALDITIDSSGIAKFAIPLDFPVYGTAFQSALLSLYNNNVFKQYLSGYEAVQTAAIGGFEVNNTLNFLEIVDHPSNKTRGTRLAHAEIMVREDVLRKFGVEPGQDLDVNNIPEELRRIIGYRIPNQDKASTIIFKIKAVLPAGYEKAIVVPPQLVKLMGSDFDVDKMFLLFPELNDEGTAKVKPNYNILSKTKDVSKVSDKELANIMLDTIEAVFSSPEHYLETLRPLDDEVLKDIRTSLLELNPSLMPTKVFTGGMYETYSAVRNMLGNKLRGLWANAMAGRNVASASDNFNLQSEFAIQIAGEIINTKFLKEIPKDAGYKYDSGLTTDRISSRYTTAAVDATKAPYHYIVNDNIITFPVELLWVHYHGDTELLHFFLNQPIIRDFVQIMSDEFNDDLSSVNIAYRRVADKYKISLGSRDLTENYKNIPNTSAMSRESIMKLSVAPARALQNFMKMYTAGRQLQQTFKLLTPDTLTGINRLEAVQSFIEKRNKFDNPLGGKIDNAPIAFYGRSRDENVLTQFFDKDSIYGLERGYYNLIKDMVGIAGIIFPITTSDATIKFKEAIKSVAGKDSLTTEQHRDINAGVMLTLLTKDESPLAHYMNVDYSERLYKPGYKDPITKKEPKTLWTRIKLAMESTAALSGNEFLAKLTDDDVNTKVKNFITFNFDATQQFTREEKARIQDDLYNLMYRPEAYVVKPKKSASEKEKEDYNNKLESIRQIGFDLCIHTLIYNGFRKSAFNYAVMIPPQFWLQPLSRDVAKDITGKDDLEPISVADFMHQESIKMQAGEYFTVEDLARFFRIYGEIRPGGSNLVDRHSLNENVSKLDESHTIKTDKYGGNRYAPGIMILRTQKGESGIYIKSNPTADSKYSVYLNMFKTSNNKKHIVGGDWLNKKSVGNSTEGYRNMLGMLQAFYDTASRKVEDKAQDITQICML